MISSYDTSALIRLTATAILLILVLVASTYASSAYSMPYLTNSRNKATLSATSESGPGILLSKDLPASANDAFPKTSGDQDMVNILGHNVQKTAIRSDFGSINLGEMQYNGNIGRTLVMGSNGNSRTLAGSHIVKIGGSSIQGPFLGVAYSNNPLAGEVLRGSAYTYLPDMPLTFDSIPPTSLVDGSLGSNDNNNNNTPQRLSGASIIGADKAVSLYNATGDKVAVAIVDTGTDFSNPDMRGTLARDAKGIPMMLDSDGQGLVLTKAKYAANINQNTGVIMNLTQIDGSGKVQLPENMTSYVYVNGTGVYLKTSQGRIPIYNSLYPTFGAPILSGVANIDWKIGKSSTDYIRSMSGVYHFGVAYQATTKLGTISLTLIPVLVVDSKTPGVYDTIIADMSYAWYYFTLGIAGAFPQTNHLIPATPNFDFTLAKPFKLGDGNEFLTYDYNNDGVPDYSAGVAGARVLDIWGVIDNKTQVVAADKANTAGAIAAKLLEPMDPSGNYFGLMYDFEGHGTSTAAIVASKGQERYNIYGNTTRYTLAGMAPGAKIIPVKSLWIGDALYGWLWATGFDLQSDGRWNYTGNHKADIMSNSWGVSSFPLLKYGLGYDILSVFSSLLMMPHTLAKDYPGTLLVDSIGNNGLGYGSVGSPNTSPFAISVGATTNNVHLQYGPFANITRLGSSTASYDNVAEFSSRGPSLLGDPKPELMAVGSYGFTPTDVTIKNLGSKKGDPNNAGAFAIFGGTSMAAPMVAGAAALVVQELRREMGTKNGTVTTSFVDPFIVKRILMSTAKDLQNDPFVQGSGRVDALAAVKLARGEAGKFSIYTNDTSKNIIKSLKPSILTYAPVLGLINNGYILQAIGVSSHQQGQLQSVTPGGESRWFAGQMAPGEKTSTDIVIDNPSSKELKVKLSNTIEKLVASYQIHNSTKLFQIDPTHGDKKFGYAPNYYNLTKIMNGSNVLSKSDLMVAHVNFPFSSFMNSTDLFANSLRIASVYAYNWHDTDRDGRVNYGELEFLNRGGSWGTVQEVRIGDPLHKFSDTPVIGVYPVPSIFSFWSGERHVNSTSMNYTLTIEFYKRVADPHIHLDRGLVTVPAGGKVAIHATIDTDSNDDSAGNSNSTINALSGIYYGEIVAQSRSSDNPSTTVMPVSYVITSKPVSKDVPVVQMPSLASHGSKYEESLGLKPNGYVGGLTDMVSRYAAGDWRSYYFNVTDPSITSMTLRMSWPHNFTSLNAMAYGPDGRMVASSVPAGVFQEFAAWPSNDWLGSSTVSEGGAFFFSQNAGENSTILYVPINGTGTYSLLVHNTLFYGGSLYEPLTVEAKFSTLNTNTTPPKVTAKVPSLIIQNATIPITIQDNDPTRISYSIDGVPQTLAMDDYHVLIDGRTLSEGRHVLTVDAKDAAGNSAINTWQFIVDRTPPVEQLFLLRGSGDGGDIGIDNRSGSYTNVALNATGATSANNVTTTTLPGIATSSNSIVINKNTNNNNNNGNSVLELDPRVPIFVSKQVTFAWNITDANGVWEKATVRMPDARPVVYSPSSSAVFDSSKVPDGRYNLTILSRDNAGNRASKTWDIVVDNTPPVVSLNRAENGDPQGIAKMMLGVQDKNPKTAILSVEGEHGQKNAMMMTRNVTGLGEYDLDTNNLSDGQYLVKLIAVDAAGNVGSANTVLSVTHTASLIQTIAILGVTAGLAGGAAIAWAVATRRRK